MASGAVVAGVDGVESRHVRVNGVEQRVLVAGPEGGPPLVMLHGLGGSADDWLEVMPRLAGQYRVVAPDAPGHGLSEKPAGFVYDRDGYVRATLGLLDALDVRRAPVLAISGGGSVAVSIALDHAERVSKLVLVDAAGLGRDVAWSYRATTLPWAPWVFRRSMRSMTPQSLEVFGKSLLHRRDRLPRGWAERRLQIWSTEGAVPAFFGTVQAGMSLRGQRVDHTRRLHEVRQPALIVWGRQDPVIPVRHGIRAARLMPNARLHIFDDCGHMPIWEYVEEFSGLVAGFLGE